MQKRMLRVLQVSALLLAVSTALSAQNRWEREVRAELSNATSVLGLLSMEPSHEPITVNLRNNTYEEIKYNLDAGQQYVFVGVCDEDCVNMHLQLYDGHHNLVDSDYEQGGYPVVSTSVGHSGNFYLRVIMHGCSDEPCWGGVGAYR